MAECPFVCIRCKTRLTELESEIVNGAVSWKDGKYNTAETREMVLRCSSCGVVVAHQAIPPETIQFDDTVVAPTPKKRSK